MTEALRGNDRYRVVRRIGAGGMGVVYEAEDLERGQAIALKTIEYDDVEKIFRLKREFRALADLSHPNLVTLYELVVANDSCFFTMELLDGVDLLAHLWGRPVDELIATAATADVSATEAAAAGDAPTVPPSSGKSPCDFERLRAVLPQLARGLYALHGAGKIHRDVKPSNIRITSAGRAVLLDFGLVAEIERGRAEGIVGTVAYMAPEQCAGDAVLTPAADWYALGVVLYQAIAGRLPFEGSASKVLYEKQTRGAGRPSQIVRDVPRDLDELCAELLAREPADRPDGRSVLRRLGDSVSESGRPLQSRSRDASFTGRDAELAQLEAALDPLAVRRASVAVVRAPSGLGKTALVERFLDRVVAKHPEALVLRGRCLDREDVPYKAIDRLIDELSDWWLARSPREAEALLPRDAHLLPTLFPVLDRVPSIADAPRTRKLADPQARRTHAFEALRETLQRLADRHTLVLFLDDMQWVDRDTTTLLLDLMRAPDPPPLLLVLTSRAEDQDVIDLVGRMDCERKTIDLGPLPETAAHALALAQLVEADQEVAQRLVREADGSPLFLLELARYLRDHHVDQVAGKGLDDVLAERVAGLGDTARLLAELVAVAGEPLTRRVLGTATAIAGAELSRQLTQLRAERVVRMSGSRADDTIEPYHARVRRAVLAPIPPERRARHHRAIAAALSGKGTAEQLARHWYNAGDVERAAEHARRAADDARAKLDFDLCARWYAIALEGAQWSDAERRALQTQLAEALADAGRPREAADRFLGAATDADGVTALELRRRAAGSLLQSGYVVEGLELTRSVLAGVGLTMTKTPLRALLRMLARRAWLRIRGLGYKPRAAGEISQAELTRVDVCEGVAFGLALVDTFRSMDFATRFLHAALRLGEPWRISRALALETDLLAATAKNARAERLLARLAELTATVDHINAPSQLETTRGFVDFFVHNRFRAAHERWSEAIASYRAIVGRAGFELDTVTMFGCWCLYYLGEIGELSKRVPAMAEEATRGGNRYTAVTLKCAFPIAWLAKLPADAIEAELDAALASWTSPDQNYQLQHLLGLCSRIELALYRGRPEDVSERIPREVRLARRALLDRTPTQGTLLHTTLARHAIAVASEAKAGSSRRAAALATARKQTRAIRKLKIPLAQACAPIFDGLVAEVEGRAEVAVAAYRTCLPHLEHHDMHLYAHAVRDRLARLVGGDEGVQLATGARGFLELQGVSDPNRMLAMLLPGPR